MQDTIRSLQFPPKYYLLQPSQTSCMLWYPFRSISWCQDLEVPPEAWPACCLHADLSQLRLAPLLPSSGISPPPLPLCLIYCLPRYLFISSTGALLPSFLLLELLLFILCICQEFIYIDRLISFHLISIFPPKYWLFPFGLRLCQ